jgi:hypothetical protein
MNGESSWGGWCVNHGFRLGLIGVVLILGSGCSSVKTTGTSRSGTEQLLLTGTWDDALCTVDFSPLAGKKVFVDPQFVSIVDKDWIIASLRRSLAERGALLPGKKEDAEVILEPSFGAYGTDERDCKVGLPQMSVVPSLTSLSAIATSSTSSSALTLSESNEQDAVVKAALLAYDAKSGQMIWESPILLNAQGKRDHFIFGSGPYRVSSRPEVEKYPEEAKQRTRRGLLRRLPGQ